MDTIFNIVIDEDCTLAPEVYTFDSFVIKPSGIRLISSILYYLYFERSVSYIFFQRCYICTLTTGVYDFDSFVLVYIILFLIVFQIFL